MARVTGPLLSIDASGKIADTLVYSHWRGIKYARMWLVPTNPNTAAQQTQRGYFASAVGSWKGTLAANQQAWRDYQGGQPTSGFNEHTKRLVKAYIASDAIHGIQVGVAVDMATAGQATLTWTTDITDIGRVRTGSTHRSYYMTDKDATTTTTHSVVVTGLTAGIKYYFFVDTDDADTLVLGGEYSGVAT